MTLSDFKGFQDIIMDFKGISWNLRNYSGTLMESKGF